MAKEVVISSRKIDPLPPEKLPSPIMRHEAMEVREALVPYAIVDEDTWRIVWTNQACERLFGYNLGEMYAKTIHELVPQPLRDKHRDHVEVFAREPFQTARPMSQGLVVQGQHRTGTVFPVTVSLHRFVHAGRKMIVAEIVDMTIGMGGHPVGDHGSYQGVAGSGSIPTLTQEQIDQYAKNKNPGVQS